MAKDHQYKKRHKSTITIKVFWIDTNGDLVLDFKSTWGSFCDSLGIFMEDLGIKEDPR